MVFASYQRDTIAAADVAILARIARYVSVALDRNQREREILAASRAKDDFLAALSHELRTPLNPVLLLASDGGMNPDYPPEARKSFSVIEKNVLLEARLIDDLLDLTRIEHGKLKLELKPIDLHAVLRDALETVAGDAADRRLSIQVDLRAETSVVAGDAIRLQQVFWNVLKNSVKFTPKGGQIWVATETDPGAHEIAAIITDTGIGMDGKELARVFDAFAQGDHAGGGRSHRFGGLGLGLAISRKLMDGHHGRIEAASAGKNQGSTFTLRFPLLPLELKMNPEAGAADSAPGAGAVVPRESRQLGSRGGIARRGRAGPPVPGPRRGQQPRPTREPRRAQQGPPFLIARAGGMITGRTKVRTPRPEPPPTLRWRRLLRRNKLRAEG